MQSSLTKALFFVFLMLLCVRTLFAALDPAELRCLDVKDNGDVELTWLIPSDPTVVFDAYLIYHSNVLGGPYNLVGTVNIYAQTTFLHVGANAQVQVGYYYLQTRSDAPIFQYSVPSDTLITIMLSAANPLNGTAPLSWNALHTPVLLSSQIYEVFYEYPATIWNAAGTTTNLSFLDTIDICNSQINFRIEQNDASGCRSVSAVDGNIYQNIIPPEIPQMDSVSLDPLSQNAILGWQASPSGDTEGYIIYQFIGGVWTPIDTVWGINNTYYENLSSNADNESESYCVAAIDSCGVTSPMTLGHSSVFLDITLDVCSDKVNLNWTQYNSFLSGLDHYELYISENAGAFSLLTNLAATEDSTSIQALNDGSTYCIYIVAVSVAGISSSSNFRCFTVNKPSLPSYIYLRYASVNNTGDVEISWILDETQVVQAYALQRSTSSSGPWTTIDYQLYAGIPAYTYIDNTAETSRQDYYYQLVVYDSCGNEAMFSNMARTILLSGDALNNLSNELQWNDYEGWTGGALDYSVYRSIDAVYESTPTVVLMPFTGWYFDDVSSFLISEGLFTYRIMAVENIGNPFLYTDTAWSNEISVQQIPRLYIPNAFAPEGYNQVFIPFGVYIDHESYSLHIFNKLGEEMFSTSNFFEGWDGRNDGKLAPLGVYNYILTLTLPGGKEFVKRSHVTLLR